MESKLYIPKKIKVGYQTRNDTYSKKLAYVIYYDDKGVLRKEKSWEGWRDKKIEPEEFDNVPTAGFILNKNIERYNWSHFSSNRTYIRVYDPRGIEFEITPENLIAILMNSNCSKRGLDGEYVYSWHGTELVLLPVSCEEYQKAVEHTERQAQKFSAKDLVPGRTYTTKQNKEVLYLGRFKWYNYNGYSYKLKKEPSRTATKYHIFIDPNNEVKRDSKYFVKSHYMLKSGAEFLAFENSEAIHVDYARHIDLFKNTIESSDIVSYEFKPLVEIPKLVLQKYTMYGHMELDRGLYLKRGDDFVEAGIYLDQTTKYGVTGAEVKGWRLPKKENTYGYRDEYRIYLNPETKSFSKEPLPRKDSYYRQDPPTLPLNDILNYNLYELWVTLENGQKIRINSFNEL